MAMEITSKDNRIFRDLRHLSMKKYRDREGLYIIEGYNLVGEALKGDADVAYLVMRRGAEAPDGLTDLNGLGTEAYVMEESLFDKIAQTETSQGVIAAVRKPDYGGGWLKEHLDADSNLVVLDRLQDPGNIGTIIRTAEGAGYSAVMTVKGTADIWSPKVIRAAAGSVFRIPIIQVEDNRELAELAASLGKKLVVTSLDTDKYYFDEDISRGIALVIGNEGNGVSSELMEMADVRIKIPMNGNLESLNASVAAGILMYEAARQVSGVK